MMNGLEVVSGLCEQPSQMKQLPKSTVKLITSTQVITSVYSVVKELVENSLDAKATSIDIKLDNYGFDKIEVRDNGSGISLMDTAYMAQPHYTSKISSATDLEHLSTYGFRGEALGSLSAVSDVLITTKTAEDPISITYILSHDGKVVNSKPSHLGQGTTVLASNLFRNLPVRRQFYSSTRKRKDELRRVEELVMACSIVSYDVRFSLKHNNNMVWQQNPVADVRSVLIGVFGVPVMTHMQHINRKCLDLDIEVDAYLPKISAPAAMVTRSSSDRCFIYVNRRTVIMKDVEKLIKKYCGSSLGIENSRHPMVFLHIIVSSQSVDVNLDPNKTSVLLHDKEKVYEFIASILEEVYGQQTEPAKANSSKEDILTTGQDSVTSFDSSVLCDENKQVTENQSAPSIVRYVSENNNVNLLPGNNQPENHSHIDTKQHTSSELELTLELLKEFEDDNISAFDISTPKSGQREFNPGSTSTQANLANTLNSKRNAESDISVKVDQHSNFDIQFDLDKINTNVSICDGGDESSANRIDSLPDKWSEGTALKNHNGDIVEPVKLLTGLNTRMANNCGPSTSGINPTIVRRTDSTSDANSKGSKSIDANQSTLFDIAIKRPPSAYLYFSKEIRPKVLAKNPGSTFIDIAALIVEKWKALSDDERKQYEDLSTMETTFKQYEEEMKSSKQDGSRTSTPTVKKKKLGKEEPLTIQKMLNNGNKQRKSSHSDIARTEKSVRFTLRDLQKNFTAGPFISQTQKSTSKPLLIIGPLKSQSAWLCCHGNTINLFQPMRAQEELLYRRLLANHKISEEAMENPLKLSGEVLGAEQWMTLLSLKMSPGRATDPHNYLLDPRVVNNGFKIRHRIGTGEQFHERLVEVVGMNNTISGFSLSVLLDVLSAISRQPSVTLIDCRPSIIIHFLQSEAVRMTRHLPNQTRDEVQELAGDLQCHLVGGTKTCFHGKPILHMLYDLEDLPRSQEIEEDISQFEAQLEL